jgi:hypothetical protein
MSAFMLRMLRRNNVKMNAPRSAAFTAIYDGISARVRMRCAYCDALFICW